MNKPTRRRLAGWLWWLRPVLNFAAVVLGFIVGIALLGLAQRVGWIASAEKAGPSSEPAGEKVYTCPMHPQIRQTVPGRCPICAMALVLATHPQAGQQDDTAIEVTPAARRLAGIEVTEVRQEAPVKRIRAVGRFTYNESRLATITTYVAGRVEHMHVSSTGATVEEGDRLVVLYSPQLYMAQTEYLVAIRRRSTGLSKRLAGLQDQLAEAALQKLKELGMTDRQIGQLQQTKKARTRSTLYSPLAGTVIARLATEGDYLDVGQPIYKIADLSTVWLQLDMFPEDAALVSIGQPVEAEAQSLPGQIFHGEVTFIDPQVDPETRCVGLRVVLRNPQGELRIGDYATASVQLPLGESQRLVTVPRSAILRANKKSVAYVETDPGRFELRSVSLGQRFADRVVVRSGLQAGEKVATKGNFLLDSQMQLAGNPSLIDPTRAENRPKHQGPLDLPGKPLRLLAGPAGDHLENFYQAYFEIQSQLAADEPPLMKSADELLRHARLLLKSPELTDQQRQLLQPAVEVDRHQITGTLQDAREVFKVISHGVIPLAAQIRGADAQRSYRHYYCPMVPGGGGDWLQVDPPLANPYWGAAMLRCGEQVHHFHLSPTASKDSSTQDLSSKDLSSKDLSSQDSSSQDLSSQDSSSKKRAGKDRLGRDSLTLSQQDETACDP